MILIIDTLFTESVALTVIQEKENEKRVKEVNYKDVKKEIENNTFNICNLKDDVIRFIKINDVPADVFESFKEYLRGCLFELTVKNLKKGFEDTLKIQEVTKSINDLDIKISIADNVFELGQLSIALDYYKNELDKIKGL